MSVALASIFLVLLLVSVGLAVLVKPKRREGTDPNCGRCGYNLTGSESNRCPECGALFIEAGVMLGHPSRRHIGWILAGLTVLLVLVVGVVGLMASHRAASRAQARAQLLRMKTTEARAALMQAQKQQSSGQTESNDNSDP